VVGLLLVWLITSQAGDYNDYQIARIGAFTVVIAGLTVLTGVNGQLSLGHGGLMMIGAYATALLAQHTGLAWPVVLLLAFAVTTAIGAVVGLGAARLRGPYLAGATLGLSLALPGLPVRWPKSLGGRTGLFVTPPSPPSWLAVSQQEWLAWVSGFLTVLVLVLLANLVHSRTGRAFAAVRDDEVASRLAGIPVARTQVLAFTVSAGCAGIGGGLLGYATTVVSPDAFPLTLSITLLTGAVLGGLGSLGGALLGGVLVVYVPQWATSLSNSTGLPTAVGANLANGCYGLVLIAAILFTPGGGGLRAVVLRLWQSLRQLPPASRSGSRPRPRS
jgi:branched-chain amino acid transport system permease protein